MLDERAASIQVVDEERGGLRLVGSRGFHPTSAAFWELVVPDSASTCAMALAGGDRVVVPDLEAAEALAGTADLHEYRRSGLRAVQSTPLLGRDGRVVGMISTHWRQPRKPAADELLLVDLLGQIAVPDGLPLRCAWCGRFEINGEFQQVPAFLQGEPALLREHSTHGICPGCLDGELDTSLGARAGDARRLARQLRGDAQALRAETEHARRRAEKNLHRANPSAVDPADPSQHDHGAGGHRRR